MSEFSSVFSNQCKLPATIASVFQAYFEVYQRQEKSLHSLLSFCHFVASLGVCVVAGVVAVVVVVLFNQKRARSTHASPNKAA